MIPGFLLVQPTNSRRSDSQRENFYVEPAYLDVDDLARQRHVEVDNQEKARVGLNSNWNKRWRVHAKYAHERLLPLRVLAGYRLLVAGYHDS